MKRPFAVIGFTVFLTVAILFNQKTGVTAAVLAVFAVALVVGLSVGKLRNGKVIPLSMASGIVACAVVLSTNLLYVRPLVSFVNGIYPLKAQITSEVEPKYGKFYCTAKTVSVNGAELSSDIRLVFSSAPEVLPYDFVEGDFAFYRPGSTDPDYLTSTLTKGMILGAYPSGEFTVTETPESEKPFGMKLIDMRKSIKRAIFRIFPDDSGSLAVAMILGDKREMPEKMYSDMRLAGIVHIVCVSGLHLSLWASLIIGFLTKLKTPRKIRNIIAALGVLFFMMLTGFSFSVMRAGIMTLVFLFADFVMRKSDSINSLGFSVLVITAISPFACASVSLQLSVLSTLGILIYNEYIKPVTVAFFENKTPKKLWSVLFGLLNTLLLTLSATLMMEPVLLYMADGFSFATIVSNLIITPAAGPAMVVVALASATCLIVPARMNIFFYAAKFLLRYIIRLSSAIAEIDFLCIDIGRPESDALMGFLFVFVGICVALSLAFKPKPVLSYALVCLVFISSVLLSSFLHRNETEVRVFDTGNGLSVLLEHEGESVLVGCGGTVFNGSEKICSVLRNTGCPDSIVIPSADETNSSYFVDILREFSPENVFADELPENAELLLGESKLIPLGNSFGCEAFTVRTHKLNGKSFIQIKNENITMLICAFPNEMISSLPPELRCADVIVSRGDYPCDIKETGVDSVIICAENQRGFTIQNELISKNVFSVATGGTGDVILTAGNGGISIRRE